MLQTLCNPKLKPLIPGYRDPSWISERILLPSLVIKNVLFEELHFLLGSSFWLCKGNIREEHNFSADWKPVWICVSLCHLPSSRRHQQFGQKLIKATLFCLSVSRLPLGMLHYWLKHLCFGVHCLADRCVQEKIFVVWVVWVFSVKSRRSCVWWNIKNFTWSILCVSFY